MGNHSYSLLLCSLSFASICCFFNHAPTRNTQDLVKNVQVQAIFGPLSSEQANFLINLGDKTHVPVITFSATSPSLSSIQSPYFIRAALDDSSQVEAISAVIKAFGWRKVVLIYVDNEFGQGIVPFLTDALEQENAHVPYRSVISSLATDDQIVAELYKLMTMQTRVFVVHMLTNLGARLFAKAKLLGMMSEDYTWIITDGMTYQLNSIDHSVLESMTGVIGVRPFIPKTEELSNFTIRYKKKLQLDNPTTLHPDLNMYGLWAYDSAIALALAVEKAALRNSTFLKVNISQNSTDLESYGVSSTGAELIQALSSTAFRGLSGEFKLVNGQLQSPPYEIVNVVGSGARVVGYWTKENGIVRDMNFTNATSKSNIGSIIWPGDETSPPKGWVPPTNGKKLRIGVPVTNGFSEFVHVIWNPDNTTKVQGYCIDIFDEIMEALPYGVPYEYIPFATLDHMMAGSYNDLVYQVYLGAFDAAVGDITIAANRSQYVDFTMPYMDSGISMVVPIKDDKSKNAWAFLKPLTWQLWVTSFCSFVFMGIVIWILEHRVSEDFRGPPWHQVGMIFWFAFSTMVFAHNNKVISNLARFVLIIWFLLVLILTQTYTASLTVQQLRPTITDVDEIIKNNENVGYKEGAFVLQFLKHIGFDEYKLLVYKSPEELDQLFSKGSRNGGIAAAFDEVPYLMLFIAKYCSKYMMVGPIYQARGFGFVFPIGSPLVPDVSRGILNFTESIGMTRIAKKWLRDYTICPESRDLLSSNSIGLESFWGLFLIVGLAAALALTIYVIKFLHENWHVIERSDPESTIWSMTIELFQKFNNRDPNYHLFKNNEHRDKDCACEGEYRNTVLESAKDHSELSRSTSSPATNGSPTPNFSSPETQSVDLHPGGDHRLENVVTKPQGEASQETQTEIELANEQLISNISRVGHIM